MGGRLAEAQAWQAAAVDAPLPGAQTHDVRMPYPYFRYWEQEMAIFRGSRGASY